jgi:hypothetical protein
MEGGREWSNRAVDAARPWQLLATFGREPREVIEKAAVRWRPQRDSNPCCWRECWNGGAAAPGRSGTPPEEGENFCLWACRHVSEPFGQIVCQLF